MGNLEFERILSPIKGVTFALTVAGDYLAPELPAGSQVFVKLVNSKAFIEWGKVYALDTCNGVIIRRIMPTLEKDKVMCLSNDILHKQPSKSAIYKNNGLKNGLLHSGPFF